MLTKLRKVQKGFTIIEVLIVLAIAALILLIVFLAIPALQRNSRNTQRKNDVAALLAAVSEYSNNNNGTLPDTTPDFSTPGAVVFNNSGTTTDAEAKVGYYNKGGGTSTGQVQVVTSGTPGPLNNAANDRVIIYLGGDCNTNGAGKPGSARQLAAVYEVESTTGGYSPACQTS